jgi:hypothetical protein
MQAQMDHGVYDIDFTREGRRRVYLFSYLLGYSRRQYLRFVGSMDLTTTLREHVRAFHHLMPPKYSSPPPRHQVELAVAVEVRHCMTVLQTVRYGRTNRPTQKILRNRSPAQNSRSCENQNLLVSGYG